MISNFIKIRISNSYLNIEQGRHRKLPLEKRLCPLCKKDVEDEYHFTLKCQILEKCRQKLFQELENIIPDFTKMSDEEKFVFMFTFNEYDVTKIIVKGVNDLYVLRNSLADKKN